MEASAGDRVENYFDQLAHHAVNAGREERALSYLLRAAERARYTAAHRQEAALLAQAREIAERLERLELVADVCARRGRAFMSVSLWAEARPELERALQLLPPELVELR